MRSDLSIIVYYHYIISSMNSDYFFDKICTFEQALKKVFSSKASSIASLTHAQKYSDCNILPVEKPQSWNHAL